MGFSIIWIMLFHCYLVGFHFFEGIPGLTWLRIFISFGNLGCEVFIILSAIGLCFSLSRKQSIKDFYKKRFSRLLIPVWIICGPFWIWQLINHIITGPELVLSLFSLRFFYDGNQQIWFVSLIAVCYLLSPLLYRLINSKKDYSAYVTLILLIITIALIFLCVKVFPGFYNKTEIALNRIPAFIVGIYLYQKVEKKDSGSLIFIPLFFSMLIGFDILNTRILQGMSSRLFSLIPALGVLFIVTLLLDILRSPLIMNVLGFFGSISLECYLTHILFITLYRHNLFLVAFVPGSILRYLLIIVLSIAVSSIVDWFQRDIIKTKHQ